MLGGTGNALALTALVVFINVVYDRPWAQDERLLLLPGILGGVIGYAVGAQIRAKGGWYWAWIALVAGTALGLFFSFLYNEVLLREPMKAGEYGYEVRLYLCFFAMNLAAFTVFGAIGWTVSANSEKGGDAE